MTDKLTRDEALANLGELWGTPRDDADRQRRHETADQVLLDHLGDPEIREAYEKVAKGSGP